VTFQILLKSVQCWCIDHRHMSSPGNGLSSDIRAKCRHRRWTFQHTAHLKKERRLHQARHVAPNAPNSRDPNPVDNAVCGVLQQRVYITDENLTRWKNWRQR